MVTFRPHHFLCALGFSGRGYSPSFVRNFARIIKVLRGPGGEETLLKVTAHTDDICAPCPHKRGSACASQETISVLDAAHSQALGWREGEVLTWGQARTRMKALTPTTFDQICQTCSWHKAGLCLAALQALRAQEAPSPE